MAFSRSTRMLLLTAATAVAVLTAPSHAVDFAVAADGSGPGSLTTPTTAATATEATSAETETTPAATEDTPAATTGDAAPVAATGSLPTDVTKTVDGWPGAVVVKGNKFFDSKTGLEFRVKGMAYYPRPNAGELAGVSNYDWTDDEHESVWRPHLAIMQDLGVNTIRLYSVDPGKVHDKFMCACAEAGIYVLVGMAAPCENCAILDEAPPKCYPDALFERIQLVYNAFAVYDNVLGFSVANENNLLREGEDGGWKTMPCVKALLRDARNYAASCGGFLREVPIGLDLADILPREAWLEYMDCAIDDNEFSRAEWLGFNPYVECDYDKNKVYSQSSGLQNLMSVYKKIQYPRPLMFGEYGCNLGENTVDGFANMREFYDAKWMNEEADMTAEIVGGNVFEFTTEIPNTLSKDVLKTDDPGRYGIGYFMPATCDHDTVPCVFTPYPEYSRLKEAYTTTKEATLKMSEYTVDRTNVLACPSNYSSSLQPMPSSITPLSCRNDEMPVCNGAVSNAGDKAKAPPSLGTISKPSNTDTSNNGDSTSVAPASTRSVSIVAVAATAVSVLASLVFV